MYVETGQYWYITDQREIRREARGSVREREREREIGGRQEGV